MNQNKDKRKTKLVFHFQPIVDICVLFEPCDIDDVQPLIDILDFKRSNGQPLSIFPPHDLNLEDAVEARLEALDRAHAILLVLSDKAAVSLLAENANESEYFGFIKKACEREKLNESRILPLFLSQVVEFEGEVGIARFSTWAYKCKNEEVRSYMERIGSLQGLFVDPADWESKWVNLYSFWQETHAQLVPLTLFNFGRELDCLQISRTFWGTCFGLCCPCIGLCGMCACCCNAKGWVHFRSGLIIGNMLVFFVAAIVCFIEGFKESPVICQQDGVNDDVSCDEQVASSKTEYYIAGTVCGIVALLIAVVARYSLVKREERRVRELLDSDELTENV